MGAYKAGPASRGFTFIWSKLVVVKIVCLYLSISNQYLLIMNSSAFFVTLRLLTPAICFRTVSIGSDFSNFPMKYLSAISFFEYTIFTSYIFCNSSNTWPRDWLLNIYQEPLSV